MFLFKKIRHRMIALVLFASLFPVFLLGLFVFLKTKEELTQKALEMQKSLAEAVRQGINAHINLYATQLEKLAQDIEIQKMKPESQAPVLFNFLDLNPLFFSCVVYDAKGNIVCITYRDRNHSDDDKIGKNIFSAKNPIHFDTANAVRKVLETGRMQVVDKLITYHGQKQMLVIVPIPSFVDSQKTIGVLSCGIQVAGPSLQATIENFFLGLDSFILLTDMEGLILAKKGRNLPEGLYKMNLSDTIKTNEFVSTTSDLGGTEYFITIGKVSAIESLIVIGTPSCEVFGFIRQIVMGIFLLTLICLIVGLFLTISLSESLTGPIMKLIEGIKKVSEGAISHRIPHEGEDELAEACHAFNEMAGQLEKNRILEDIWSRKWRPPS